MGLGVVRVLGDFIIHSLLWFFHSIRKQAMWLHGGKSFQAEVTAWKKSPYVGI